MRKFAIICFVVAFLIYVAGALMSWQGFLINWDTYWKIVGVVGGMASIIGMLGIALNPLTDADIRNFRTKSLVELAQTAAEIENKQGMLKEANEQLTSLKIKKDELEVLVKKASLVLYYKEELDRLYQRLLTLLDKNREINETIVSIRQAETNASSLNAEIEQNDDIQDILNTIQKAKTRPISKSALFELAIDRFFSNMTIRL